MPVKKKAKPTDHHFNDNFPGSDQRPYTRFFEAYSEKEKWALDRAAGALEPLHPTRRSERLTSSSDSKSVATPPNTNSMQYSSQLTNVALINTKPANFSFTQFAPSKLKIANSNFVPSKIKIITR